MFIRYKLICFLWSNRLLRTKTDGKGTEKKLYMQMIAQKYAKKNLRLHPFSLFKNLQLFFYVEVWKCGSKKKPPRLHDEVALKT